MNDESGHLGGTLRYLVAATHWSLLAGSGLIIGAGVALVARWPEALWPLHGTALGLMVGMAAVAVDERCATVVDAQAPAESEFPIRPVMRPSPRAELMYQGLAAELASVIR